MLDLDRNGISLQAAHASRAFYDIKGDGWRYRMGWTTGGDGLLAYDANGDGKIAGKNELSFKDYVVGAQTDLQGLVAFDSNQDGKLSALDALWSDLTVWLDANGNGESEAGELQTLIEAGVQEISLASDKQFTTQNGNTIHGTTRVTMTDGSHIQAADVTFAVSSDVLLINPDGTQEVLTRRASSAATAIHGSDGADVLVGASGSDYIGAGNGDDFIYDDQGNDVIEGGDGEDVIYSGADDDVVLAGSGDDTVFSGKGNDVVIGGEGADALLGEEGNDVLFGGDGNDLVDGGLGNDVLSGDAGDDNLYGGSGADALFGGDGNDLLQGDAGNDLLDGGQGTDTMLGGAGNDTYVVDNVGDVVVEDLSAGTDLVRASVSHTLSDNVENLTLTGTADATGTGNSLDNVLTGNSGSNVLLGGAGSDTLDGGGGSDTLIGGTGDDTYLLGTSTGQDTVQDAAGRDRVLVRGDRSAADIELTRHGQDLSVGIKGTQDALTLQGWFGGVAGQASAGMIESIQFENGSAAISVNYIVGLLGNHAPTAVGDTNSTTEDTSEATTGNVLLNDSDVDQSLDTSQYLSVTNVGSHQGSYGQLQLSRNGNYTYVLNNDLASVQALARDETVYETFTYTVQDNAVDNMSTSAQLRIAITGKNDAPTVQVALTSQSAREKQAFSYTVPLATFSDVDNADVLSYSALALASGGTTQALPAWLSFNASTRTFSGTPGSSDGGSFEFVVTATDKAGASVSTNIILDIADALAGSGANINVITGSWKNDTLNGTRRSETLIGNGGTDKIFAGEGDNTVIAHGADTLITAGSGNDVITAAYGNNTIDAGDGNNKIDAGGGNNTIKSGSGNDFITVGWGTSTINAGEGNNTVVSAGGNTLVQTGAGADKITTSAGNDVITTGVGDDTISSGWGSDTIDAGAGNDLIRAGGDNDTVRAGSGDDTIINDQWSSDKYFYAAGDGQDLMLDAGGQDSLQLENLRSDQIWFSKTGSDLKLSIIGTRDCITLQNWYLGDQYPGSKYHIEQFKTSDGKTLLDSKVQNLVSAMAAFAPPAAGETTLTPNYATALNTVIAANWQ